MAHLSAWLRAHTLAVDLVGTTLLVGFLVLSHTNGDGPAYQNGLLFTQPDWAAVAWTCAFWPALAFRRTRPQTAALGFAGLCAAQLLLGPAFLGVDFLSLLVVCTVIERGDARHSRAFAVLALSMAAFAGLAIGAAIVVGPLSWHFAHGFPCVTPEEMSNGPSAAQLDQLAAGTVHVCSGTPVTQSLAFTAGVLTVGALSLTLAAIMVGFWRRARSRQVELLRARNEAMRAREERAAQVAASAERARIARDMHDVVAHSLSIVIVQADGGRYAGAHDPATARRVMRTIRDEADHALHDMGRLLGVFDASNAGAAGTRAGTGGGVGPAIRAGAPIGGSAGMRAGDGAGAGDVADLAHVDALVAQARAASPRSAIGRRVLGVPEPERLGPAGNVVAFRVVQEALSNARKYAGPTARVEVAEDWRPDGLRITVTDDGPGSASAADGHAPGFGLMGMRERVTKIGGTVEAGPIDAGPIGTGQADTAEDCGNPDDSLRRSSRESSVSAERIMTDDAVPCAATGTSDAASGSGFRVAAFIPFPSPATAEAQSDVIPAEASMTPTTQSSPMRPSSSRPSPVPEAPDDGTRRRHNRIERFSLWSQRHYLVFDVLTAALILFLFNSSSSLISGLRDAADLFELAFTVAIIVPLAFRRRFPQASAATVAVVCAVQLAAVQYLIPVDMLVPLSLYSVIAYGPARARRWVFPTIAAELALIGVQVTLEGLHVSYSPIRATFISYIGLNNFPDTPRRQVMEALALSLAATVGTIGAVCLAAVAAGLWTRAKGDNLRVLETQREAIAEEAAQGRALAVNGERERIAAQIQAEVTGTLAEVVRRADEGLAMLDGLSGAGADGNGIMNGDGNAADVNGGNAHGNDSTGDDGGHLAEPGGNGHHEDSHDGSARITNRVAIDGGNAAAPSPSPKQIADAFAAIATAGRDALARMRRLLGVLRANRGGLDDGHMALSPAAALDEQLHDAVRSTGRDDWHRAEQHDTSV